MRLKDRIFTKRAHVDSAVERLREEERRMLDLAKTLRAVPSPAIKEATDAASTF